MTTIKTGKGDFLMVEVPEGSSPFIDSVFGWLRFRVFVNFKEIPTTNDIKLPEGQYTFLCTSRGITNDYITDIVESFYPEASSNIQAWENQFDWYVNYEDVGAGVVEPEQSFTSLLKHHQLSAPNYAILKVINTKQ